MKGQLVFEFVVAAVIFFGIVLYTINYLNASVSAFSSDFYDNSLQNKVLQISELLVHNKGLWNNSIPEVVGLLEESPVLNHTKIAYLGNYCNTNYMNLLERLGLERRTPYGIRYYDIRIQINETNNLGNPIMSCGKKIPENIQVAEIQRFALSEGDEILNVHIWIW